jgi:hypothetical protein
MPYDTLYPPPPESDMGETDLLPTEIQQTFDSIYAVMKEKRRLQHSPSTSESSLDGHQSNSKRSRERFDLLDAESLTEEKTEDDSESKEIEEGGGTGSSNLLEYASSQQDEDLEMRRFEAAVAAAVLIDKEMTRWERGVAELEKLFFEHYDDPGESLLNIPLPFLPFLVENASDSAVDVTPTA